LGRISAENSTTRWDANLPNVVAVALGGSRAAGRERRDSDWDLGIYYRHSFDADSLRSLGFEGTVVDPGEWGRLVNGGAWLTIGHERVDLLYRDIDFVTHWTEEAPVALKSTMYSAMSRECLPTLWLESWLSASCCMGGFHGLHIRTP
jgi:hypothetical protein